MSGIGSRALISNSSAGGMDDSLTYLTLLELKLEENRITTTCTRTTIHLRTTHYQTLLLSLFRIYSCKILLSFSHCTRSTS